MSVNIDLWKIFVTTAQSEFAYLEREFNFSCISKNYPFVIYENDKWLIKVFYDEQRNYELDFVVRKSGTDDRQYPSVHPERLIETMEPGALKGFLTPFPEAKKGSIEAEPRFLTHAPSTKVTLEVEVKMLADILKKYGSGIFKGDKEALKKFDKIWKPNYRTNWFSEFFERFQKF